jgi:branched-chain amino acid transport system substrate-binding protein
MIQTSIDSGAFDKFILADGMFGDSLLKNVDGDLSGTFGTVPGTDSKGSASFAEMAKGAGIKAGGPFTGESYDAAALLILAMQSGGSTDRAALASNVLAVANTPGEKIMPGELGKALRILAGGGAVDYVGATNVELVGPGEASGSYKEFEIKGKAFTTVRFR